LTRVPRPPSPTDRTPPGETQPSACSDREVVARIGAGDVAAFEALYRAHAPALLAFAHSQVRSRELAEDLVQDLFLALWRHRKKWDLRTSLRAYLLGALRNRIISYRRSMQAREGALRRVETATLASVAEPSGADHRVREAELAEAIEKAIGALPPRCRETFLLVRQQNLTYTEAAEVLGISVKAVEMNMVRALAALRKELGAWRT